MTTPTSNPGIDWEDRINSQKKLGWDSGPFFTHRPTVRHPHVRQARDAAARPSRRAATIAVVCLGLPVVALTLGIMLIAWKAY